MKIKQNIINHIAFVIDASYSIQLAHVTTDIVHLFDDQIRDWQRRAKEFDQETRVSVYLFNTSVKCIAFDRDISRINSIRDIYSPSGGTALIDATLQVIGELNDVPQKDGDHSFLLSIITDGEERNSKSYVTTLANAIKRLDDNWTVSILVPSQRGVYEAKQFGFPAGNIQVWDAASSHGIEEGGRVLSRATDTYYKARASGMRGTKSLFAVDMSKISSSKVKVNLDPLPPRDYEVLVVHKEDYIKPFFEKRTGLEYRVGSGYFELTKPETIQPYKQVLIEDKRNGRVYYGDSARKIIKLPNYSIKVSPENFGDYNVFIQSTSTNRKLVKDTRLIVLR